MTQLKEVEEVDEELRPFGLLLLKLGSEDAAQKACDALELYMRRFKCAVVVDDDGLHFDQGMDAEDWAMLRCAILWHQYPEGDHKARALVELEAACDAAQKRTWARRREASANEPNI